MASLYTCLSEGRRLCQARLGHGKPIYRCPSNGGRLCQARLGHGKPIYIYAFEMVVSYVRLG